MNMGYAVWERRMKNETWDVRGMRERGRESHKIQEGERASSYVVGDSKKRTQPGAVQLRCQYVWS